MTTDEKSIDMRTRALVVDDDEFGRAIHSDMLKAGGFDVRTASDGEEALALVEEFAPYLILMDLVMPGMDGRVVCQRIRAMKLEVRPSVIVVSALDDTEVVAEALGKGADDFLVKPVDQTELLARVEAKLRIREFYMEVERDKRNLETILDITKAASSTLDSREVLRIVVDRVAENTGSERCSVVLAAGKDVGYVLASNDVPELKDLKIDLGRYPEIKESIRERDFVSIEDLGDQPVPEEMEGLMDELRGMSVLVVPISFGEEVLGTLFLRANKRCKGFGPKEIEFCKVVAGATYPALKNARIFEDMMRKKEEDHVKLGKMEAIGLLAGGIAHDFNNLLTGITGNISLAMESVDPEDKVYERLQAAEKATVYAKELTLQLLTFSKGGAPVTEAVSIAEIIEGSVGFVLRGSNVKYEVFIPENLPPVEVDRGQINQVLNNLSINADQAMPEGGTLKICAQCIEVGEEDELPLGRGTYVKLKFKDSGTGIPEEHLTRIFDPYFTTKQKGSGLGLAGAYSIVKNHHGHIDVNSKFGSGTTFYIYLPVSEETIADKVVESIIAGRGKVLVMDDDDVVREVATEILLRIGYSVETAVEGGEAIELYKKAMGTGSPFDAVVMDLTIKGGMGGKEAVKALLGVAPEARVIVSSGYSKDPVMSNYKKYGFSGVIAKPFTIAALSRVMNRVIDGKDLPSVPSTT